MKLVKYYLLKSITILITIFSFSGLDGCSQERKEDVYAVFKLSYNKLGDQHVTDGICGTAFFVNDSTALTANHILSKQNFQPNLGFKHCQYWLLSTNSNLNIPIKKVYLLDYPDVDATLIQFNEIAPGIV